MMYEQERDFVQFLVDFSTHIKLYHWFARKEHIHSALGELYKNTDEIIDDIVEGLIAYQPKNAMTSLFKITPLKIEATVIDPIEMYLTFQSHAFIEWMHFWGTKKLPHIEHMLKDITSHVSKALYQVRLSKM